MKSGPEARTGRSADMFTIGKILSYIVIMVRLIVKDVAERGLDAHRLAFFIFRPIAF